MRIHTLHPRPTRAGSRAENGLTLIELLIAVGLLAILATLAVPSFQRQIAAANVTNATNELLATISRARTDAIRIGQRVTACKSSNGTQCDTSSAGWQTGWIIFVDPERSSSGPAAVDTGETITFKVSALTGVTVIGNGDTANYISYAADGRAKKMNGGFMAGTIRVCSNSAALNDDNRARDICISRSGRAVLITPSGIANTCPAPGPSNC